MYVWWLVRHWLFGVKMTSSFYNQSKQAEVFIFMFQEWCQDMTKQLLRPNQSLYKYLSLTKERRFFSSVMTAYFGHTPLGPPFRLILPKWRLRHLVSLAMIVWRTLPKPLRASFLSNFIWYYIFHAVPIEITIFFFLIPSSTEIGYGTFTDTLVSFGGRPSLRIWII